MKVEEELKKRLTAKLELARFLQDTVAEMARDINRNRSGQVAATAEELYQFMKEVRRGGSTKLAHQGTPNCHACQDRSKCHYR